MFPDLLQLLLGGTLLTSLGAGIKYVVDLARTTSKDRSPVGLVINATAAAESSIALMSKINDELTDENTRLVAANACLRKALQEADEREVRLKAEVSRLESRVHELEAAVAALSRDLTTFREQEFPDA